MLPRQIQYRKKVLWMKQPTNVMPYEHEWCCIFVLYISYVLGYSDYHTYMNLCDITVSNNQKSPYFGLGPHTLIPTYFCNCLCRPLPMYINQVAKGLCISENVYQTLLSEYLYRNSLPVQLQCCKSAQCPGPEGCMCHIWWISPAIST